MEEPIARRVWERIFLEVYVDPHGPAMATQRHLEREFDYAIDIGRPHDLEGERGFGCWCLPRVQKWAHGMVLCHRRRVGTFWDD